jgi:hypothetical protein
MTMRLEHCLALFPEERGKLPQRWVKTGVRGIHGRGRFDSLSPGEREKLPPPGNNSPNGGAFAAMENHLPLPGGEGRGEGEPFPLLTGSGLGPV